MPKERSDTQGDNYPLKLTGRQRESLVHHTRLKRAIKQKVEQLLLAEPVSPVHRQPPGGPILAGRLFYIRPWSLSTKLRQPK